MFFRRLCVSLSKAPLKPSSLSSISSSHLLNSHSFPILPSNLITGRLVIQRATSVKSRCSISVYSTNSKMGESRKHLVTSPPYPDNVGGIEMFRALESSLGTFSSEPIAPNPSPLIIVVSGPSGVGKDAVIKRLREVRANLHFVVTATSRGKRPGEVDGKDYLFLSKDEFLAMIEKNELLEYALVYGDYKGIPKQQIRDYMGKGCDIVLRVDVQGAATLRRILKNSAVFVFLAAESEEALVRRLIERKTESVETLLMRVAAAREELRHLNEFDYVVVNKEGELESSVLLLESIIDAEKAKVVHRPAVHLDDLPFKSCGSDT